MAVAAVVVGALTAPPDPGLDAWLGAPRAAALRAALRDRAHAWAAGAAVALDGATAPPPGAGAPVRVPEVAGFDELPALLDGHDGPVVLVGTDVPRLGAAHLAGAREDLDDGVLLALAWGNDARPFLLVLARFEPALLAQAGGGLDDLSVAAVERDSVVGMLRLERRVVSATDARALAADPCAPADLRALATPPVRAGR